MAMPGNAFTSASESQLEGVLDWRTANHSLDTPTPTCLKE